MSTRDEFPYVHGLTGGYGDGVEIVEAGGEAPPVVVLPLASRDDADDLPFRHGRDAIGQPPLAQRAAHQAREECAALVEASTDILSEATARKLASRIRALNEPQRRAWPLSLIEIPDNRR